MLDHQDVVGFLLANQEFRMLGVQGVSGDHLPGQVQGLQQGREAGDLVGLAVHLGLGEHRTRVLIGRRQQVHPLPIGAGMPGAPHRLAVHRQRPPPRPGFLTDGVQPPRQPRPHRGIQRAWIHTFQHPPDGGLIRRHEPAGQRITPDP